MKSSKVVCALWLSVVAGTCFSCSSSSSGVAMDCQNSGVTCSTSGSQIQACCTKDGKTCEYRVGTKKYPCSGSNCETAAQNVVNDCGGGTTTGTGGSSGSTGTGGSSGSSGSSGYTCASSGITCTKTGGTIQACCNSTATQCKYTTGGSEFPCNGTTCDSAASSVVSYCG
jgi:hypothetical protein